MNFEEYEKYQLKMIEQSYRQRGFSFEPEPRIQGLQYRFDAIARSDSGEVIIIELVNKYQSSRGMQNKLRAFEELSKLQPNVKVDFRYVDVDAGALQLARPRPQDAGHPNLQQLLKARMPRFDSEQIDATRPFLDMWTLHVALIRAYSVNLDLDYAGTGSMLDLYNEMLESHSLIAPEAVVDDVTQDLFDLFAEAQGALQGAPIDRRTFLQLRGHVLEVRKQVRKHLAMIQANRIKDQKNKA